jgi:predicted DNA-binding protein
MKCAARSERDVDAVFPVGHTGNTVPTLTLKVPKLIKAQITAAAKQRGVTQSELVRRAIEAHLREEPTQPTPYDLVADLIEKLPARRSHPRLDPSKKRDWDGFGLPGPEYRVWLKKRARHDRRTR